MLDFDTFLRIPYIDPYNGFDLSPDGTKAAVAWNLSGQWEIYELDLRNVGQVANLFKGPGGKFAPRYSPDGTRIAWALDLDGSENFHIVIHDFKTGESRDLTPSVPYAIQPSFAWSPDGKRIAYLADKNGRFDVFVFDTDGSNDRLLFSPGGPAYQVKWSPDGRHLAVTAEMEGQNHGTFVVPLDGGEAKRVGGVMDAHYPAWSPDSKSLAFASNASGWSQIGVYHLDSGEINWLTNGAHNSTTPAFAPDGKTLAWVRAVGADTRLEVRRGDGSTHLARTEAGFLHPPRFSPDGESVYFPFESPCHPVDLWRYNVVSETFEAVTRSLPPELKADDFIMPEEITYPGLDGTPVPAILYKPKNAGPHNPGVVYIHGGPTWHISFLWYPIMSHMAARGWTVIAPNYRGSTGYGLAWQTANRFELGRLDSDDCAAAAFYLAKSGLADPAKIGVTGRSHGGYLTMTCLTRNPELFAVGSAVVPFLNWFTGHENSRDDLQHWDIENMGDPTTNRDLWHERSPYFHLDRIEAPVQLICGETDPRCPASESLAARDKLVELGREVELLLYKNEGHAFLDVNNVVDSEVKRVAFLAKALEA
ncbi:MAG: S9 family peptidase [Chloroflexota bacterium]